MSEVDKRYATQRRFFPRIDEMIDLCDSRFERKLTPRALIKAYLMVTSGAEGYYTCACREFSADCIKAAHELKTTTATVAAAVESKLVNGRWLYAKFEPEKWRVEDALCFAQQYRLPELTRVQLCLRAGIGLQPLWHTTQLSREYFFVGDRIRDYLAEEALQVLAVIKALENEMRDNPDKIARNCAIIRYGANFKDFQEFGCRCWREMNKLFAAGHARGV